MRLQGILVSCLALVALSDAWYLRQSKSKKKVAFIEGGATSFKGVVTALSWKYELEPKEKVPAASCTARKECKLPGDSTLVVCGEGGQCPDGRHMRILRFMYERAKAFQGLSKRAQDHIKRKLTEKAEELKKKAEEMKKKKTEETKKENAEEIKKNETKDMKKKTAEEMRKKKTEGLKKAAGEWKKRIQEMKKRAEAKKKENSGTKKQKKEVKPRSKKTRKAKGRRGRRRN